MKTLVLGNVFVDVIVNVDALPKTGDDIMCNKQLISIGGCAYNVATVLKNFEVEHDLISPVGNGIYGEIIREELEKNDYKKYITDDSSDNGYCLCLVEKDGERSFITIRGIESTYKSKWLEDIDDSEYDNIYVSGYEMEGESGVIISNWLLKQKDKTLFFAPGPRINYIQKKTMEKILTLNPILHLNDDEALKYTNKSNIMDAAKEINRLTLNSVFITLGKDGVMYFNGNNYKFIDGISTQVVNTIGAGDSHIGAIIASYSKGCNYDECCYIANKVASKVVGYEGSRFEYKLYFKDEYLMYNYS
ncbi:kinase [Romboutsia maritimum]|uniref:Kinase n=1 Tax=Romboutsia maritimum TaxID=2020948 RepID=A0A371IVT1_9FIRM|nr:PfkB family carbohydrate kinase [Romboutsia maritimum]RDY24593.1 kinase [Romboutsia maritimum]